MNPYESTKSAHTNSDPPVSATSKKLGPLIVCMMLILTVVVSILRLALPSIGTVTSPRFGSHGLIVFAGPLSNNRTRTYEATQTHKCHLCLAPIETEKVRRILASDHSEALVVTSRFVN